MTIESPHQNKKMSFDIPQSRMSFKYTLEEMDKNDLEAVLKMGKKKCPQMIKGK